jgi:thioesterase domain-containing protein
MAFEIAHQLQSRGAKVDLVILLDTKAKHLNAYRTLWRKWHKRWKRRASTSQFARDFMGAAARKIGVEAHCRDGGGERPWYLEEKLLTQLQRSYRLECIESRGVFFEAQESDVVAARYWGKLFGRGLDVLPVPGDHYSMLLAEQHIRKLAGEMRNVFLRELETAT